MFATTTIVCYGISTFFSYFVDLLLCFIFCIFVCTGEYGKKTPPVQSLSYVLTLALDIILICCHICVSTLYPFSHSAISLTSISNTFVCYRI